MSEDFSFGSSEVGGIVGAKTKIGPGRGFGGERVKKLGLHEPVFVVAAFWPWIREEYKYPLENDMCWDRGNEFGGFGFEENEIGELGAITFALGSFHAVA